MSADRFGTRPLVRVEPDSVLESHPRLFEALADAFCVEVVSSRADPGGLAARIAFDHPTPSSATGVPLLHLTQSAPQEGTPRKIAFPRSDFLPVCLRDRTLLDAALLEPLAARDGEDVLGSTSDGPVWVADRETGFERAVGIPSELGPDDVLRDRFRPGSAFPLLPVVVFLNRVAERHGVRRPPLRAAFVIDDPNVHRPTYGFIDFRRLAALAKVEGFHVAFATIPLDAWLADTRTLDSFRGERPGLSLVVHGNNHLHGELARNVTDARRLAEMAQAMRRIEKLERRTGLPIPKVMVPPHGQCSRETVIQLARVGFEAICMSSPGSTFTSRPSLTRWLPAGMLEGFPILPRHQMAADRDEFVFRALLGQPLIPYGHHTDAADGLDVFAEVARDVSSLGDVRWMSLADIARTNAHVVERPGMTLVRLFSRDASIEIDGPSTVVVESQDDLGEIRLHAAATTFLGPGPHDIDGPARVRIVTRRRDARAPGSVEAPPWRPWPIARRVLTEARDRMQPAAARAHRGFGPAVSSTSRPGR